MTAEATRLGTATPLPPHWVTPVVVTATPTAENQATAQIMQRQATAVALTTGQPPNMAVVEATLEAGGRICDTCRGTFVAVKPGHPAYHRW